VPTIETRRPPAIAEPAPVSFAGPARRRLPWVLNLLLVYLAGITIFGKGPTYIGVEPLFWGEIVLALSVWWALRRWHRVSLRTAESRTLTAFVCCFILVGAVETAIDYPVWGLNALRDSAVWYYSLFYFVGLVIASSRESATFVSRWKLFWVIAIPWGVAEFLSDHRLSALSPVLPGSRGVQMLSNSTSELAQSIGLGSLLLIYDPGIARRWLGTFPRILLAGAGLAIVLTFTGRGARLAVLAALVVLLAVNLVQRSGRVLRRRLSAIFLILVAALGIAFASGSDIVSILSLDRFQEISLGGVEGTAEWRSEWWSGIYDEVMSKNPAFGLGFGDALVEYNPLVETTDMSALTARAPHNFNVTIFARMGFIGAFIWSGILMFGILIPLFRIMTPASPAATIEAKYRSFWIIAIIAAWINSSFGVLMEGPVMGIPFWLILGLLSIKPPLSPKVVRSSRVQEHA
jgi:hypothetical protein